MYSNFAAFKEEKDAGEGSAEEGPVEVGVWCSVVQVVSVSVEYKARCSLKSWLVLYLILYTGS